MDGLRAKSRLSPAPRAARGAAMPCAWLQEGADIIAVDICGSPAVTPSCRHRRPTTSRRPPTSQGLNRRIVTAQVDVRDSAGSPAPWRGCRTARPIRYRLANAGIGTSGDTLDQMDESRMAGHDRRQPHRACGSLSKPGCRTSLAGGRGCFIARRAQSAGSRPILHVGHYVSAKHGVVGLMRTFAVELGPALPSGSTRFIPPTSIRPC